MSRAYEIFKSERPDIVADGEIQGDFAVNPAMIQDRFEFSELSEKGANILVFPNLDSANISYKLVKELDKEVVNVGPILLGLKKPAHILQLNSSVEEILHIISVAVIDAQLQAKKNK
jgi:malate dehydrogenase (oxaloacetate-decarboxylating)(NADP+)